MNVFRSVGTSVQRVDALAKVRGEHIFPSDHALPGMLWLRVVRSARAHARIVAINTACAAAIDGVACVLTAADIPGVNLFGLAIADQPVLGVDKVRYVGEPLVIVAAESDAIARAACAKVEVVYEDLPLVDDPLTAEDRTALHPKGNLCSEVRLNVGDVVPLLDACEEVVELAYSTNRQEHAFLETEAGTSWIDENGRLNLSVGAQNPFNDRRQVAAALGLPLDQVRVLNPMMGGAFGGKEDCNVQILLALVTHKTGRPGRMMFDRSESLLSSVKRHAFHVRYRVGATRDGELKALDVDMVADAGAYTTLSPAVVGQAAEHASGPYHYEASRVVGKSVFTNNGNASAYRGFGNPQVTIGIEQAIDELARRTKLSPFEIRRRNLIRKGETAGASFVMAADTALGPLLDAAEQGPIWTGRSAFKSLAPAWTRRGVGVSAIWQGYGLGAELEKGAAVKLSLTTAGRFRVEVGTPDLGAGNVTAFIQIAADELNTPTAHFEYIAGDSLGPDSGSSHASRTVFVVGNAVAQAARELRDKIIAAAAPLIGSTAVQIGDGMIRGATKALTLGDCAQAIGALCVETSFQPKMPRAVSSGIPHAGFGYSVQLVSVEVDMLTGEVTVCEAENYLDTGKTINPLGVACQIEGGFAQGLGYALYENAIYEGGKLRNPNFSNYVIPSVRDVPARIGTAIFETPDITSPLGVRGVAEIGLTPVAATVANAVHDAIGVRFAAYPILPEMILEAVRARTAA